MAYIRTLPNGNFRADVRMKGITKNKTFPTAKLAQDWADGLESSIKTILLLSHDELAKLFDDQIERMGGNDLFKQLGIDLFSIRNQAKLATINLLSKKELLQLSAQQIEQMGGVELFIQAGKRIRYKTFREVCNDYLAKWNKKDYSGQLRRVSYWCDIFGDRIITDIDVFDIRDHVDTMINNGERPTTINRKKAVLSSVFKFALSRGYIDENIVQNIVVDDDTKRRERILTDDERVRLLKACRDSHWPKLYLVVLMGMATGARKGELFNLRWCDIDFKENSAYVRDSKNGTSRILHLAPPVIAELKKFQEVGSNLIFPSAEIPEQPFDFRKSWSKALRIAQIPEKDVLNSDGTVKLEKFTFHCLRHSFCSALSDSGHDVSQIAELAGHKCIQTTMRYIHQNRSKKQQVVNQLATTFKL